METEKQNRDNFMSTLNQLSNWLELSKVYILDVEKERKAYAVQQKIQKILDAENIKSEVEIQPCPLGMGDVIIKFECDEFIVRNTQEFMDVIKELDNFEIYPLNSGIKFAGVISKVANVIATYKEEK